MSEQNQEMTANTQLLDNIWGVEPVQAQAQPQVAEAQSTEQGQQQQQAPLPAAQTQEQNIPAPTTPDYNSWVKENFGVDTVEAAKQEWEKVKNFKPEEPKYKTIEELLGDKEDEIATYLSTKKRIDRLTTAQLENNTDTAAEIIKLAMQQTNPELSAEDADFMFSEKFATHSKPIQDLVNESDEDYTIRVNQWQEQVSRTQRQMIIEAKMVKPALEKLKAELKYPEIHTQTAQVAEPKPEELARLQAIRDTYVSTLNEDYSKFEGFNAPYKDEEVEFTVPYTISDEEKTSLKADLENFDSDSFFEERWFTKEGKPKVTQMMEDVYLLKNSKKVFQKIANEAGSQRLLEKTKQLSNVSVNGNGQTTFNPQQPDQQKQLLDSIWGVTSN